MRSTMPDSTLPSCVRSTRGQAGPCLHVPALCTLAASEVHLPSSSAVDWPTVARPSGTRWREPIQPWVMRRSAALLAAYMDPRRGVTPLRSMDLPRAALMVAWPSHLRAASSGRPRLLHTVSWVSVAHASRQPPSTAPPAPLVQLVAHFLVDALDEERRAVAWLDGVLAVVLEDGLLTETISDLESVAVAEGLTSS